MNFCSSSLCLIIFQFILSYIHKFSHPNHLFHIWSINKSYKFYFLSIPLQQSPNCMLNLLLSVLCIQSYSTFCDPTDCSPPDSSIHRIFQARILEWVAISSSSRGSSWPSGNLLCLLCFLHCETDSLHCAAWEVVTRALFRVHHLLVLKYVLYSQVYFPHMHFPSIIYQSCKYFLLP